MSLNRYFSMLDGGSTVETVTVFIVLPNLVSSCYQTRCGTSNATVYTLIPHFNVPLFAASSSAFLGPREREREGVLHAEK